MRGLLFFLLLSISGTLLGQVTVSSITLDDPPTNAQSSVDFTITFNVAVEITDTNGLGLNTTGSISGASVTSTTAGSSTSHTVTVNTGSGSGDIRLDVTNLTSFDPNLTALYSSGPSYTIDRTDPVISPISISSNNSNSTSLAKPGDVVTVSFTTDEPLSLVDNVRIRSGGSDVDDTEAVNNSGNNYTISVTMASGDNNGPITFRFRATDQYGNITPNITAVTDGSSVTFDKTAPSISNRQITSNNSNDSDWAKVGDVITLTFTAGEALPSNPTVSFESGGSSIASSVSVTNPSSNNWQATFTVGASDPEGNVTFEIQATDAAGNIRTETSVSSGQSDVTIDRTPPTLSPVMLNAYNDEDSWARPNETVRLEVDPDEPLEGNLVATFLSGGAAIADGSISYGESGGVYRADYTANSSDTEGAVTFNVTAEDLAGNQTIATSTTDGSSVTFDKTRPDIVDITGASVIDNGSNNFEIDISFTEGVYGDESPPRDALVTADFNITDNNNPSGFNATVQSVTRTNGSSTQPGDVNYTISFSTNSTPNGSTRIEIEEGNDIYDIAGNDLISSASTGELIFADNFGPNITTSVVQPDNSYITVTFDEPVYGDNSMGSGINAGDFKANIVQGAGNVTAASITNVLTLADGIPAGGETQFKVFISLTGSPASGDETIQLLPQNNTSIFDEFGNPSDEASSPPFTSPVESLNDTEPPSLTSVSIASNNTINSTALAINGSVVILTFNADEPLSFGDIVIEFRSGGVIVNNAPDYSNPSGNTYTASYMVNSGDTDGIVSFTLNYKDNSPAKNSGPTVTSTTDLSTVTVDKGLPQVQNITFDVNPIYENSLTQRVTVTFDETMQTTVNPALTVSGSNWGSQVDTGVGLGWINSTTFVADFTHNGNEEETSINVSLPGASGAKDLAGNVASASSTFSFNVDTQKPDADITYDDPAELPGNEDTYFRQGQTITIIATFNESLAGSPTPQIRIFGTLNDNGGSPLPPTDVTMDMTFSSSTIYTYDYTIPAGNGDLSIQLLTGTDAAGNIVSLTPASGGSFTVDNINPVLDIPTNPLVPAVGGFNIPPDQSYELYFTELVKGTGTNDILVRVTDSSFPQTVSSSAIQNDFTDVLVDFTLASLLQEQSVYEVIVPNGALVDRAGNPFVGIPASNWTFTTFGAPVLDPIPAAGCPGDIITITGDFFVGIDEIVFGSAGGAVATTNFTLESGNENQELTVTVPDNVVFTQDGGLTQGVPIVFNKNLSTPNNNFAQRTTTSSDRIKVGPTSAQLVVVSPANASVCNDPTNSIDEATLSVNITGGSGNYLLTFDDGDPSTPLIVDFPYSSGSTFNVNPPQGGDPGNNNYTLVAVKDTDSDLSAISCNSPDNGSPVNVMEYERSLTDAGGISGIVEICLATQNSINLLNITEMGIIPSITGSVTTGTWSIESGPSSGSGGFSSNFNDKTKAYDGSASNVYYPSLADAAFDGGIFLKLTSTDPSNPNPCAASEDLLNIRFVSTQTANIGNIPSACVNDPIVQIDGSFGGGADGLLWSTTTPTVDEVNNFTGTEWGFTDDTSAPFTYTITSTTEDAYYRMSPSELLARTATLELIPTNSIPADQCGPNPPAKQLILNAIENPVTSVSTSDLSVCSYEENVVYSVSSTSTSSSYTWTIPNLGTGPDDNKIISGQGSNTIVVSFGNVTGLNQIQVDQTRDSDGCPAVTLDYDVQVNALPNVSYTPIVTNFSSEADPVELNKNGTDASPLPDLGSVPEPTLASFAGPGVLINNAENTPGNPDKFFFDPGSVSLSTSHPITYTVKDNNGCESTSAPALFTVFDASEALIFSSTQETLSETFCADTSSFSIELSQSFLLGQLNPGFEFSRFEGPGISDNGDQKTAILDPGEPFELILGGIIDVNYYQVNSLTADEVFFGSQPIIINPVPVPSPGPIPSEFCSDDANFILSRDLVLNPTGQDKDTVIFEIVGGDPEGIISNPQPELYQIIPSNVPFAEDEFSGKTYTIRYYYRDANGCDDESLEDVTFYQRPPKPLLLEEEFICAEGNSFLLEANNQVPGATVNWYNSLENIGDPLSVVSQGASFLAPLQEGTTIYYATQIINNCESEPTTITIGRIIEPRFVRSGLCTNQETIFNLPESTDLTTLSKIIWTITEEDGTETVIEQEGDDKSLEFTYVFDNPGVKTINLQYISTLGCPAVEPFEHEIFILPTITVADLYLEDFENTSNAWISWGLGENDSIWNNVIPTYDFVANNKVWVTNGSGPYGAKIPEGEELEAFVYSPCFDISALSRPMISLDTWVDMEAQFGNIVQYSVDDNDLNWVTLGTDETGINWYDDQIDNPPGNAESNSSNLLKYSWSVKDELEARNSKHSLDLSPDEKSNVIFRVVFRGEGNLAATEDGFAFDNFQIMDRNRLVVIEDFENSSDASRAENSALNNYAEIANNNVLRIHYRADANDELFTNSPFQDDIKSRVQYYNIQSPPQTIYSGNEGQELFSTSSGVPNNSFDNQGKIIADRLSLTLAEIEIPEIRLNATDVLEVEADIVTTSSELKNAIVSIAIVENPITQDEVSSVPEEGFQYIIQKFLPNPSGISVGLEQNVSTTVSTVWNDPFAYNPENLSVIVFVQKPDSKEILQSAKMPFELNSITGIEDQLVENGIAVYPNPADDQLIVTWNAETNPSRLRLFDINGRQLLDFEVSEFETYRNLDVSKVKSGIYWLQVEDRSNILSQEKIIISH